MRLAIAILSFLCIAWTLRVRTDLQVRQTNDTNWPPFFETNYAVCVSIVEPCTNTWVVEGTTDFTNWQGLGQYVTGNVERCMFIPPNSAPTNSPWPTFQFYRARMIQ